MNPEDRKLTEKSVEELEIDDGELRTIRHRLSEEKSALQLQLAEINGKLVNRLPHDQYRKLQSQRAEVIKQLQAKDCDISGLNTKLRELRTVLEFRKSRSFGKNKVEKLVEMRDRWHGFSMDGANHQKAREAAWQFSQELKTLLKDYFNPTDQPT